MDAVHPATAPRSEEPRHGPASACTDPTRSGGTCSTGYRDVPGDGCLWIHARGRDLANARRERDKMVARDMS